MKLGYMHNVSFHDLKFMSIWVWSCLLIESLDWFSLLEGCEKWMSDIFYSYSRHNSFCGPQTVFEPRKKPCIYKVQVFKGPASNFCFSFTENLHCALTPSQLNWSLAKKTLRSCPTHTADTTSSSTPRWHFVVGSIFLLWRHHSSLEKSRNYVECWL